MLVFSNYVHLHYGPSLHHQMSHSDKARLYQNGVLGYAWEVDRSSLSLPHNLVGYASFDVLNGYGRDTITSTRNTTSEEASAVLLHPIDAFLATDASDARQGILFHGRECCYCSGWWCRRCV